jgi:hypothetical protein
MTFVIETSNPRCSNGKPYERTEVEPGDFVLRLCKELGRPLTKPEQLFLKRGAQIRHEDQRTGRTITAYRKSKVLA